MIEGIVPGILIYLYTNYSTSEKSPLWKVFHLTFLYKHPIPKSGGRDPKPPRIGAYAQSYIRHEVRGSTAQFIGFCVIAY